jgi:hypothetical protein
VVPDAHLDNLSTSSDSEIPTVNLPLPHLDDSGGSGEFSSRMEVSPLENDSDVDGTSEGQGENESNEDDSIMDEDERTLAAPESSEDESVMGEVDPGPGLSPVESGASDYVTGENGSQTSDYATPEEDPPLTDSPPSARPSNHPSTRGRRTESTLTSHYRPGERKSVRRKKAINYLTYDSDFKQTTSSRFDLVCLHVDDV